MKAEAKKQLAALNSISSLTTGKIEAATKLQTSTQQQIDSAQSKLDSNTEKIANMYEEAGFGALDSAYTINAEEGKIYIIDNNMQKYVGEDGKIDTENYTYEELNNEIYKATATSQYEYAEKAIAAADRINAGTATDEDYALLGVSQTSTDTSAKRVYAEDSEIELNGAKFTNNTNTYSINGLTITATALTGDNEITITTDNDVDGMYDAIKSLISDYNSLIRDRYSL